MTSNGSRVMSSGYMQWAKTNLRARFSLASSGLMNYSLSKLPVAVEELELSGPSYYGYEPLQKALAAKSGVPVESVVAATGTSMANHLVMAALLAPGDEVLIEEPTYELLVSTAQYLGAEVKRFVRSAKSDFQIDPEEVGRHISSKTRLIILANLHNPTNALTGEEMLKALGAMARQAGAHVLVDEVYLDALFEKAPESAFHLGNEFITTNSLTKVYGLSGLRCGWILAAPELAQKLWRLNDLFGVIPAHAAERLSCIALANLAQIADYAQQILKTNGQLINSFFNAHTNQLDFKPYSFGTVSFPRLKNNRVEELFELLSQKYETSIVPGRFFEMPEHFRIGLGGDPEMFKEGLERLSMALSEI